MNILLITRYFPPLDSIATCRMYSFAKYLTRLGHKVTVLTTTKKKQTSFPLSWDLSSMEVIEVDYFDPIANLGIDKKEHFLQTPKVLSNSFLSRIKKKMIDLYRDHLNERIPGRTDFWIHPAVKAIKKMQQERKEFDVIISSYGPPSCLIVGYFAKKILGSYWICDYRDLWLENKIYKGLFPFTKLETYIEKKIVPYAEMLLTVSLPLKETLHRKFYPIPVHVIENGFDEEMLSKVKGEYFPKKKSSFRIVYTGSLYWHARNPTPLFQAIRELIDERRLNKDIEVLFYGTFTGPLFETIKKYALESIVHFMGNVSQDESHRIQKSADCLLFIESPTEDGIMTGKLFEYLYFNTPILAIGIKKDSSPGKLIDEAKAGVVCESSTEIIKKALLDFTCSRYQTKKEKALINEYSRKRQVEKLFQLIR